MKTAGVNEVINTAVEVQRELHNCPNDCPFWFLVSFLFYFFFRFGIHVEPVGCLRRLRQRLHLSTLLSP